MVLWLDIYFRKNLCTTVGHCYGDSGVPNTLNENDRWAHVCFKNIKIFFYINQYRQIIIGITSWGPYCEHTPAVNFKVSGDLKAWIWSIAPEAKESYGCNLWWSSFYSIFWFYLRINEIFSLRISHEIQNIWKFA